MADTTYKRVALKNSAGEYLDPWITRETTIDDTTKSSTYPPTTAAVKTYVDQSMEGAGLPVGTIFAYPSSTPPAGAWLLNGQLIENCTTLYPTFWAWIIAQKNAGTIRTITEALFTSERNSTGNCGAFVVDTSAGSVRLPLVVDGFIQGADSSTKGNSVAAGLPNITGTFDSIGSGASGAISATASGGQISAGASSAGYWYSYAKTLDASSTTDSIYGDSTTVQPPSVRFCWCIQVYNTSTALSEQEAAQLASEIQTKISTDFSNADSALDVVIASNYDATTGRWYRKYRNGRMEQGGYEAFSAKSTTISLPLAFPDTSYMIMTQKEKPAATSWTPGSNPIGISAKTTSTFIVGTNADYGSGYYISWLAVGKWE